MGPASVTRPTGRVSAQRAHCRVGSGRQDRQSTDPSPRTTTGSRRSPQMAQTLWKRTSLRQHFPQIDPSGARRVLPVFVPQPTQVRMPWDRRGFVAVLIRHPDGEYACDEPAVSPLHHQRPCGPAG
jgi:hypothetical protein